MKSSPNSNQFRDFLLDRLPPEEAEAIEERMFQDEACFSDLQDAEDEMIEEYVTEAMDSSEAQLFGARVERDPTLQERVAIRRVLIRTLQRSPAVAAVGPVRTLPSHRRMWNRFLVPGFAMAILILFAVSYEAVHRKELPSQATGTAAPVQGPAGQKAMAQAAAVLFLPAHVARGASQQPSVLHVGSASLVRLELETPSGDASARWDVHIRDAGGSVFSAEGLAPQQAGVVSYVVAQVPASQLASKAYQVTLSPVSTSSGAASLSWNLEVVR
jgi:hypothetical protein